MKLKGLWKAVNVAEVVFNPACSSCCGLLKAGEWTAFLMCILP